MKQYISPILLFVLLLGVNKTRAQTQGHNPALVAGHFEMKNTSGPDTNYVNVNYVLSPAPFTNNMNVALNTPGNTFFTVDILNAADSILIHWAPTATSYDYNSNIDISSLSAGNYQVNINDTNSVVLYTIPFTK